MTFAHRSMTLQVLKDPLTPLDTYVACLKFIQLQESIEGDEDNRVLYNPDIYEIFLTAALHQDIAKLEALKPFQFTRAARSYVVNNYLVELKDDSANLKDSKISLLLRIIPEEDKNNLPLAFYKKIIEANPRSILQFSQPPITILIEAIRQGNLFNDFHFNKLFQDEVKNIAACLDAVATQFGAIQASKIIKFGSSSFQQKYKTLKETRITLRDVVAFDAPTTETINKIVSLINSNFSKTDFTDSSLNKILIENFKQNNILKHLYPSIESAGNAKEMEVFITALFPPTYDYARKAQTVLSTELGPLPSYEESKGLAVGRPNFFPLPSAPFLAQAPLPPQNPLFQEEAVNLHYNPEAKDSPNLG